MSTTPNRVTSRSGAEGEGEIDWLFPARGKTRFRFGAVGSADGFRGFLPRALCADLRAHDPAAVMDARAVG
jgi:hypothetical protein